ncbi:MAG: Type II secretion system F domain protein [Candidatus Giovannonibacteria bacterium GW2011_GWC2_44_9]|uniref:Type II secretion system F domain protein n=3 Tax=Candidatus Giovannoniibacteriota TaxID=1752738 RepID=A0A0G1ITT9_9BACT|nr:MAG: Type II secretion system F domain protein [Candidatus Giovannonibacteria bacterium GW2011_GWB1_44_23]KKT62560.1 MAG: Type II secretion system F domain protein [Candidatus Giovannonibacteria bacterium GW2011_GWA1_44_29]KKT83816.1 MAG: Type II secretion system F domain protein [Candidatus Giovannonibacteria bacterium GW2011_GWC2_44_9]KKT91326.1 MAG: Type II secretion system F domain protein [Parcubacteria group bacterium GW2011_GWC1_45_13]
MPLYHYKARDKEGWDVEGKREGKDKYNLAHALRAEGMTPLFILEVGGADRKKTLNDYIPKFLKRISLEEKLNFTRNTAVMIGAGVSLAKALEVMARQTTNEKFKIIILAIEEAIKKGNNFSDALGEHPEVFQKFYQEMARAGEKSGKLEESLKLVALQLKKDYTIRRKVRGAMVYPAIVIIAMIGIGILMMIYVVPTLVSTFKELNVELPLSTKFIIFISASILQSGLIFLFVVVLLGYFGYRWGRSQSGKEKIDWIFTNLPVIKGINQKFNAARTCRTLSSLISSGVNILEAISITKGVLQNHFYQNILEDARLKIQRGDTISRAFLGSENLYPPLVGEMVAIGEETGELSGMLLRLASFYENEVNQATKDLSTIIEPLLMIVIGIVVGFFAVSMISPMYNLVGAF